MTHTFLEEVLSVTPKPHVDKKIVDKFLKRIKRGKLTKEENELEHFCSFFVPINVKSKSVYIGYHIKANDWIPPGGHINLGEAPRQTVYREFFEELNHQLTDETVELFDLTIKHVSNPYRNCKIHYDFWYVVSMKESVDFAFTKNEFYEAKWMGFIEAKRRMRLPDYWQVINKVFTLKL